MKNFMTRDKQIEPQVLVEQPRTGQMNYNKSGSLMAIVKYEGWDRVDVLISTLLHSGEIKYYFKTGCEYRNFQKGSIQSPYDRTVGNVGYIGEGNYSHNSHKDFYTSWANMIARCYDEKLYSNTKVRSYVDASVDPYFHCFQNFAKWAEENYYSIKGEKINLDKDLLIKNNKIYSPDSCCFLPAYINTMLTTRKSERGELPIGVTYKEFCGNKPYRASITLNSEHHHLGMFSTPEEAFDAYKVAKEKEIKKIANYYWNEKDCKSIPQFKKIYDVMLTYQVEMFD